MSLRRLSLLSIILALLTGFQVLAQVHFTFTNTGNNAIVGIPTSANPNINGTPLANGDEIGAFTPAGLCVGAAVWPGANTAIAVWGDNDLTPAIDGIAPGEQIYYRVWDQSTNTEYSTVNVTYSQGNGTYAVNGIYVLSSLSAVGAPSTPTLSSPSNGATGVSITPTLSWNASTGATSYQLQVSISPSFTTTIVNQSGITATSYAVSGLTNNTVYYWRVNATNASGTSSYSAPRSFTTVGVSSPPVPTLSSPSNGATGVSITPTLSWNASTGATSYQLQVSTSSSFTTTAVNQSGLTATSYAVSGLTNGTFYYWRVNATNAGGTSAYSTVWTFTTIVAAPSAPTLSSPTNGATGVSITPTLSWNASMGAASYQLQVSISSSFTTTLVDQSGITATSYAASGLTAGIVYYWRVNATNAGGTSVYSTTWNFTTAGVASSPAAPMLVSPGNGATGISTSPTMLWNASSGAASYQLQVSSNSNFSTTEVNQAGITGTSYRVSGLVNNTTYYWRVNATNAGGTSLYSDVWSFTTTEIPQAPLTAPTLGSPADGSTGVSTNPTLTWNATAGALSYQLQVSTSPGFTSLIVDKSEITSTSYTVSGLVSNATYYWHVSTTYNNGTSPYSARRSFTTMVSAPQAPSLVEPPDGAAGVSTNPTLVWEQSTGAASYQLQISTEPGFSTIVLDRSGITSTSYSVSGLARNTTYYWRVNAANDGRSGQWSAVRSLTTSNLAGVEGWSGMPKEIRLLQNYPNPFNGSTIIPFELSRTARVSIEIYSALGQRVASLEQGIRSAGSYRVFWQPQMSSGVYFYRLAVDGTPLLAKKMIYLR
jgi:hypothetical protein